MTKKIIEISGNKLAYIIHSELLEIGVRNADDIFEELMNKNKSSVFITIDDSIKIHETKEAEEAEDSVAYVVFEGSKMKLFRNKDKAMQYHDALKALGNPYKSIRLEKHDLV